MLSILVNLLESEHCKTCMIFLWQKPAQQLVRIKQVPNSRNKITSNTETTCTAPGGNLDDFDYFLGRENQVAGKIGEGGTGSQYLRSKNATTKSKSLFCVDRSMRWHDFIKYQNDRNNKTKCIDLKPLANRYTYIERNTETRKVEAVGVKNGKEIQL